MNELMPWASSGAAGRFAVAMLIAFAVTRWLRRPDPVEEEQ